MILDGHDPQQVVNDIYEEFLNLGLRERCQKKSAKKSHRANVQKVHKDKINRKREMADRVQDQDQLDAKIGQKASKNKTNWMLKRTLKKLKFLRYQQMFHMHRGRLARLLMDNTEALKCQTPSDVVHTSFKVRWEILACFRGLDTFPPYTGAHNLEFEAPITRKEIAKNMHEMDKTSAPGPDGITLGHLTKADPKFSLLEEIFNLWLFTGTFPDALWDCRTVLLPKSTEESRLSNIKNWRPITIAPTVLRLFSRIVTARLTSACPLNPRQKEFTCVLRCSKNLKLLQLLVKHCKREKRELGMVFGHGQGF